MLKKILLIILVMICVSCGKAEKKIYNENDFRIEYDKEYDRYVCSLKNGKDIYYVPSEMVEVRILPNDRYEYYDLFLEDNKPYRLIMYIGVKE